jgi:DNA repair exonuclease SbcCD ATPase subunit
MNEEMTNTEETTEETTAMVTPTEEPTEVVTPEPKKTAPKKNTAVSPRTLKKHIKERDAKIEELQAELENEKSKSAHYFREMKKAQEIEAGSRETTMATINNIRQQLETITNTVALVGYLGGAK